MCYCVLTSCYTAHPDPPPPPSTLRAAEEERQEARRVLLLKETRLLQTIDRLKAAAAPVMRAQREARQLAAMAAPKPWRMADGRVLQVMTPDTQRAAELAAAHQALVAADGSNLDARLAALLVAKRHAGAVGCRQVLPPAGYHGPCSYPANRTLPPLPAPLLCPPPLQPPGPQCHQPGGQGSRPAQPRARCGHHGGPPDAAGQQFPVPGPGLGAAMLLPSASCASMQSVTPLLLPSIGMCKYLHDSQVPQ